VALKEKGSGYTARDFIVAVLVAGNIQHTIRQENGVNVRSKHRRTRRYNETGDKATIFCSNDGLLLLLFQKRQATIALRAIVA